MTLYPLLPHAIHGGPQGDETELLDFSVNTNPLGPNPELIKIWRAADPSGYPDPSYTQVRLALANHHQVEPDGVVLGVGASELLHRIGRAFLRPGDQVVSLGAPFGELARAVELQRGQLTILPRTGGATIPPVRMLYLSNPHSPTGHLLTPAAWPQAELVVVDEAYHPFVAEQVEWPLAPNVLRVQSPGKAHGLLGLRLAYAITMPVLAARLVNLQPAWVLPGPMAEVLAALPSQEPFLNQTMPQVRDWATALARTLSAQPTGLHFFTVQVSNARRAAADLLAQGIRVRDCTSFGLPDQLRIATRLPAENQLLVEQWRKLAQQW